MRNGRNGHGSGRRLSWWLLASVLVVALLVVLYAWQARTAYTQLTAAQSRVAELREHVVAGDVAAVRETADAFAGHTDRARTAVAGPHWTALTVLPWVGPHVDAVQTVTAAVDDLASGALPSLAEALELLDPEEVGPRDGRIRLAPIEAAGPAVRTVHEEVAAAADRMAGIETDGLHRRLEDPVADLAAALGDLRAQTGTAVKAVDLLPPMLGADEPRHYLVLSQNSAEPRALGGMVGAFLLVRADAGDIEILQHRTPSSLGRRETPVLPLSRAERALYGTQLGRYIQNATATPHFPRAAALAATRWKEDTGRVVDGVVALDPYTLQLLLGAVGSVEVPGGRSLTGENAAQVLLNDVYREVPDAQQDQFFSAAASATFEAVLSGGGDLRSTAEALGEAVRQRRVMLWSRHAAEQRVLRGTRLAGELGAEPGGRPVLGVFLHDRTPAKLAFYQDMHVRLQPTSCDEGRTSFDVTVRLRSRVPPGAGGLTESQTGGGRHVPTGHVRTEVFVYAPPGWRIDDVRRSDGPPRLASHVHDDHFVVRQTVALAPGAGVRLKYRVEADAALDTAPRVRTTPPSVEGQTTVATTHCPF